MGVVAGCPMIAWMLLAKITRRHPDSNAARKILCVPRRLFSSSDPSKSAFWRWIGREMNDSIDPLTRGQALPEVGDIQD